MEWIDTALFIFQDIIGGLSFASFLLVFIIPIAELSDQFILTSPVSPFVTVTLSILAVIFYPGCDRWTPARFVHCAIVI